MPSELLSAGSVAQMVEDIAAGARRGVSLQLVEIGRVIREGLAPEKFARVHSDVAHEAAAAVHRSYGQSVHRHGGLSGYRSGSGYGARYSGGVLREALHNPGLVTSDANGVYFVNTGPLNRAAKQWARLNFGAGGIAGPRPAKFDIQFGSLVVGALGIEGEARPAFFLPKGVWTERGAFYPSSMTPPEGEGSFPQRTRVLTKGIRSRNFFDAGVRVMADQTLEGYQNVLKELFDEGVSKVRPRETLVTVRAR